MQETSSNVCQKYVRVVDEYSTESRAKFQMCSGLGRDKVLGVVSRLVVSRQSVVLRIQSLGVTTHRRTPTGTQVHSVIPHCPHLSLRSELFMRQKLLSSPQIEPSEFLIFKYRRMSTVPNPTNGAAWLSALLQTLNKRVSDHLILTIDPSISTLCSTSSCRAVHCSTLSHGTTFRVHVHLRRLEFEQRLRKNVQNM